MRSLVVPFRFASAEEGGGLATTRDPHALIKARIINVLVTMPYERAMLPEYGANIYSLLFDSTDELVFADWKTDALSIVNQYITGANVIDMEITQGRSKGYNQYGEPTTLYVTVYYQMPPDDATSFTFALVDPNALTIDTPVV